MYATSTSRLDEFVMKATRQTDTNEAAANRQP